MHYNKHQKLKMDMQVKGLTQHKLANAFKCSQATINIVLSGSGTSKKINFEELKKYVDGYGQ